MGLKSVSSKDNNTKLGAPDEKLKECGSALATVVTITIYKQKMGAKTLALLHHYLLIQVSRVKGKNSLGKNINFSERWILAEKGRAARKFQFEVKVKIIGSDEADKMRSNDFEKYSVDLSANDHDSIKIPTDELVHILNGTDTTYSILRENCWKYADNTMRRVIKGLLKLPDISGNMRVKLQIAAANIPPLELPDDGVRMGLSATGLGFMLTYGKVEERKGRGTFVTTAPIEAHIFGFARKFIWKMLKFPETNNVFLKTLYKNVICLIGKLGISCTLQILIKVVVLIILGFCLYKIIRSVWKEGIVISNRREGFLK